jgi:general secretion pathway protein A
MYNAFFSFAEEPFNITPDPRFLFLTDSHREALSAMAYGIRARKGFILISGEVGTGKTTLLHYLVKVLDPTIKTVFISRDKLTAEDLLQDILTALDIPLGDGSIPTMIRQLSAYLKETPDRGENLAILIDEAQGLSRETLEGLRMLSNIETGETKLLQIVLAGQPELEKNLNSEELRQFKQRIWIRRKIRTIT